MQINGTPGNRKEPCARVEVCGRRGEEGTTALWQGKRCRRFPADIRSRALQKRILLHSATRLENLRIPPSNRLELLKGDRAGQHSIRINDQWRICFHWSGQHAAGVEIGSVTVHGAGSPRRSRESLAFETRGDRRLDHILSVATEVPLASPQPHAGTSSRIGRQPVLAASIRVSGL